MDKSAIAETLPPGAAQMTLHVPRPTKLMRQAAIPRGYDLHLSAFFSMIRVPLQAGEHQKGDSLRQAA